MSALFQSLTSLTLHDPWMLLLVLLVPLALLVRRLRGAPAVRFAPGAFLRRDPREGELKTPGSWRVRLLPLPPALQIAGLLLAATALARPVHIVQLPFEKEGIDILLCLDCSSSMTTRDMDPRRTRLDVARDAAARFITGRGNLQRLA